MYVKGLNDCLRLTKGTPIENTTACLRRRMFVPRFVLVSEHFVDAHHAVSRDTGTPDIS